MDNQKIAKELLRIAKEMSSSPQHVVSFKLDQKLKKVKSAAIALDDAVVEMGKVLDDVEDQVSSSGELVGYVREIRERLNEASYTDLMSSSTPMSRSISELVKELEN